MYESELEQLHTYLVETFQDSDQDIFFEKLDALGYDRDPDYEVPLYRSEIFSEQPDTILYRIMTTDSYSAVAEQLGHKDYIYMVWPESPVGPFDDDPHLMTLQALEGHLPRKR